MRREEESEREGTGLGEVDRGEKVGSRLIEIGGEVRGRTGGNGEEWGGKGKREREASFILFPREDLSIPLNHSSLRKGFPFFPLPLFSLRSSSLYYPPPPQLPLLGVLAHSPPPCD